MGMSTGPVVFLVSMLVTLDKASYVSASNYFLVIVYLAVASMLVGASSGAVNWLSAHLFFMAIYNKIVYKD